MTLSVTFGYAQIIDRDINKPLSETDLRKSFGYCPDAIILDKYGVTYTIESCPLSRMYVDNWDKLDNSTRLQIVTELENSGWRIENE